MEKTKNFYWILENTKDKIFYGPIPEPKKHTELNHLFIGMGGAPFACYIFASSKINADSIVEKLKNDGYEEWKN